MRILIKNLITHPPLQEGDKRLLELAGFRDPLATYNQGRYLKEKFPHLLDERSVAALATVIDNETSWTLTREGGDTVTPSLLAYIKDKKYGIPPKNRKLGNKSDDSFTTMETADSVKFRGGGLLQITGRWNYSRFVAPLFMKQTGKTIYTATDSELTSFMNDPLYMFDIASKYLHARVPGPWTAESIFNAIPYRPESKYLTLGAALKRSQELSTIWSRTESNTSSASSNIGGRLPFIKYPKFKFTTLTNEKQK